MECGENGAYFCHNMRTSWLGVRLGRLIVSVYEAWGHHGVYLLRLPERAPQPAWLPHALVSSRCWGSGSRGQRGQALWEPPSWLADSCPLAVSSHGREKEGVWSLFSSFLYWCIIDFQCCVNFCCTAKWFSHTHTRTHTHIYIYILFLYTLFHIVYHRILNIVRCAIH